MSLVVRNARVRTARRRPSTKKLTSVPSYVPHRKCLGLDHDQTNGLRRWEMPAVGVGDGMGKDVVSEVFPRSRWNVPGVVDVVSANFSPNAAPFPLPRCTGAPPGGSTSSKKIQKKEKKIKKRIDTEVPNR